MTGLEKRSHTSFLTAVIFPLLESRRRLTQKDQSSENLHNHRLGGAHGLYCRFLSAIEKAGSRRAAA
jgi:hypothetical protein